MAFSPSLHSLTGKAMGMSQATPTDARSYFFDEVNFVYRPYQDTAEVLTYLNLSKYRAGNFYIFINDGGTLNGDGTFTGGTISTWTFRDGTANINLVEATGAAAYGDLTDAGTADLPVVNAPLAAALDLKANNISYVTLADENWDIGTEPLVESSIAADIDYIVTGGTNGLSRGNIIIEKTATAVVQFNGVEYPTRDVGDRDGKTSVTVVKQLDGSYYFSPDYVVVPAGPDTTPPQLLATSEVISDTEIRFDFDEITQGSATGITAEVDSGGGFGAPIAATAITGTGINRTVTFGATPVFAVGDDVRVNYDATTGDITDMAATPNPLADITAFTVVNGLTGGGGFPVTEDFESTAVGNVPTGWAATAGLVVDDTASINGLQELALPTGSGAKFLAYSGGVSGIATAGTVLLRKLTSGAMGSGGIFVRANSAVPASITDCYIGWMEFGPSPVLRIYKVVAGVYTQLAVVPNNFAVTDTDVYTLTYDVDASHVHTIVVQRSSDNFYLTNIGGWQAGATDALTHTEGTPEFTSAGHVGFWAGDLPGTADMYADDVSFT